MGTSESVIGIARGASYGDSTAAFPPRRTIQDIRTGRRPHYPPGRDVEISGTGFSHTVPISHDHHQVSMFETSEQENLAKGAFSILALLVKGKSECYRNEFIDENDQVHVVSRSAKSLSQRIERKLSRQFFRKNFSVAVLSSIDEIIKDFGELYPTLAPVISATMAAAGVDGIRLVMQASREGYIDRVTGKPVWPIHQLPIAPFIGLHNKQGDNIGTLLEQGKIEDIVVAYEKLCPGLSTGQMMLDEIAIALEVHPEFHREYHISKGELTQEDFERIRHHIERRIVRNALHAQRAIGFDPLYTNRVML